MKKSGWRTGIVLAVMFLTAVMVPPSSASDGSAMVVGRIFHIEGDLLRYVPEENDWVAVVRDAPFGTEDTLFSGNRGMAELIAPNGTWIRIGNATQIQFVALDTDLSEMDLASGMARFSNKSSDTVIQVTSPFGYVLAYPGAAFDFYVGENSVEVDAVKGTVHFVHSATDARYDVSTGSPSLLADQQQVSSDEGTVDPEWNRWNADRENFWAAKARGRGRGRGRSVEYLPPSLRDDAYALDENGRWESVPYEGASRWFWRPRVAAGWSPFTVGRWTDWYGDQTWIPAEPFGYVTHHYGNWIYVRNNWYWAPPVVSVRVGLPLLDVGFHWYPGRVSWIHTGAYVGWVPLAPRETYYSHRNWGGPHAVVVNSVNITRININVRNYAYANRAIVVSQNNFYGVNNYTKVRVSNIKPATIVNNYRAAPIINNTVINNYTTIKQRHNYTNAAVKEKPHNAVINRIQHNEKIIKEDRKEKASVVQERVKGIKEGRVNREARIEAPKVTNYIVPAGDVNRPKSEMNLRQKEIKTGGKPDQRVKPEQPAKPESVAPVRPPQSEQPAAQPERAAPAKQSRQEKPRQPAEPVSVAPAKPAQPEQPAARPERAAPAKQSRQEKPRQPAEPVSVAPVKPAQPEQPAARPERAAPAKPNRQVKPGQPAGPERVAPARPPQSPQPTTRPERMAPAKSEGTIKPPEKGAEEKLREQRPVQKQIEKPKEPRPSGKNTDQQGRRKDPDKEKPNS